MQIQLKRHHGRYSKYKQTGIPWLGEVPEEWEIRKMIWNAKKIGSGSTPQAGNESYYENGEISWIITGDLNDGILHESSKKITKKAFFEHSALKIYPKNSVVIAMYGATIGKLAITNFDACTNQACCVIQTNRKMSPKYCFYWLLGNKQNIINLSYGGGQPNINQEIVKNLRISTPSFAEQLSITNLLDEKSALIERIIEAKQKQIELLKEKRASLINRVVTRGIDENVEMKDSGIEWIGKIPTGWEIKKLKTLCKIFGRIGFRGYTTLDLVGEGEGALSLSPSNICSNTMLYKERTYLSWKKYEESPEIKVFDGDILFVKTGSTIGKVAIFEKTDELVTLNPQLVVLKKLKLNNRFLFYFMVSLAFQFQVQGSITGGSTPALNQTKLGGYYVYVPIKEEQEKIVAFLDCETQKIDKAVALIERSISSLEEYKTSLISHVVTGKIKITR